MKSILADEELCLHFQLEKSPFVERILARGYEVLYFTEPIDEMLANGIQTYQNMRFVDVAKDGVKFGDEGEQLPFSLPPDRRS